MIALIRSLIAPLMALWLHWQGRKSAKLDELQADAMAHERINNAETGIGATDSERINRLREFAAKHGNR